MISEGGRRAFPSIIASVGSTCEDLQHLTETLRTGSRSTYRGTAYETDPHGIATTE